MIIVCIVSLSFKKKLKKKTFCLILQIWDPLHFITKSTIGWAFHLRGYMWRNLHKRPKRKKKDNTASYPANLEEIYFKKEKNQHVSLTWLQCASSPKKDLPTRFHCTVVVSCVWRVDRFGQSVETPSSLLITAAVAGSVKDTGLGFSWPRSEPNHVVFRRTCVSIFFILG